MASKKSTWAKFPHDAKAFDYGGDALKKAWADLHGGDAEPFPDNKRAGALIKAAGRATPKGLEPDRLAQTLQDAWRAFHRGDFQLATELGQSVGALGASVSCKAMGVHAAYLLDDEAEQLKRFEQVAEIAQDAIGALPDEANSHYRHAFGLGRYSQGISIGKALAQGLAGKVRKSLDATLSLAPKHAEAHTALGLYHAEIIHKVGSMIGGLTYGAKASEAEKHLATALKLTPNSPIAHVEYGNLLMLLHGEKREDDAADAYERASKLKPRDAMEKLDAEYARSLIE